MDTSKIEEFKRIIANNNKFVLTCHTNADGDALGSTLGLRKVLLNLGKEATVITPDIPPTFYSWMPGAKTIKVYDRDTDNCNSLIDAADVVMILDYNALKRVKSLGEKLIEANKTTIMIDHHTDPETQANVTFSFSDSPATCEIAFNLLREAGFDDIIDIDAATNFYTGIITDTGGLSYNSSNPNIYLTVADLLRKGIDKPYIHDKIFNNKAMKRIKLLGFTISHRLRRIGNLPLTIMALNNDDLERYKYNTGDTEGFVNIPLQVKDVIANVLILERPDSIKLSIRSKGDFPVNEFATMYFNGGGHFNAAGGTFTGSFDEAVDTYISCMSKYYEEWAKKKLK